MNEKLLAAFGLNHKEIKLYRVVLKMGVASPVMLARATGIKRTTAYSIARTLVEKGLLVEDASKRPRLFSPSSPGAVQGLIAEEKKRLNVREKIFKQLAEELTKNEAEKTYPVPQIRFIPEEKIRQFLKEEAYKWDSSMLRYDTIMWGFQDHTYVEQYTDAIELYWRKNAKQIRLKMLTNISAAELKLTKKYPRREMRPWPKANFVSGIWVMGDYLVTVNTRHKPYYLVEIHDAPLAHDLRELFKTLWETVR